MNPKRLAFFLLLAAIFAQMWFASTPLPLGGPNVMLGGLTVLLSAFCVLRRAVRIEKRSAAVCALVEDYRPIIPVVAVSALLAAWALAVYLFTDTLQSQSVRLAQMALGCGVLFAVYLSVDSMRRAKFMALAIVTATFVSALFGFGVLLVGDPFLSVWLHIADVNAEKMDVVFTEGRIAGLALNVGIFAMQLAVGICLSFAALLYSPFEQGKTGGRTCNAALFVMSMTMATALVVNATRSAILGTLVGAVIVALPSLRAPLLRRRLLFIVPLQAIWMLAFFNPVFAVHDIVSLLVTDGFLVTDGLPAIDGLAAGDRLADSGDRAVIYHKRIGGITAGAEYAVQLRTQNDRGFGQASEIVAVTENDGSLTLSWNAPNDLNIDGYQFRLRGHRQTAWRPWRNFSLSPQVGDGAPCNTDDSAFYDLAAGFDGSGDYEVIGHMFGGMDLRYPYNVQLRVRYGREYGAEKCEVTAHPGNEGALTLAWRKADDPGITGYQFRLRVPDEKEWRQWLDFVPSMSSKGPVIDALATDSSGLADNGNRPTLRHVIEGLIPRAECRVRLRAQNEYGFGAASREITAKAENDGSLMLAWREPDDPTSITDYQYRLWNPAMERWKPWQSFVPVAGSGHRLAMSDPAGEVNDKEWKLLAARTARSLSDRGLDGNTRIFQISDWSVLIRIHMAATALRYSWDHPLGTGLYRPTASYVSTMLKPWEVENILNESPHNQFLHALVLYGFPGLILLLLFYVLVLRSLIRSIRSVMRGQDADLHFLATGVVGATAAYSIVTLLVPLGPFIVDWSHFFLIGLAFSLERMATAYRGNGPICNPPPAQG